MARTEEEDTRSPLDKNGSKLSAAVCQVMTSDPREEVRTELKLLHNEMIKLRSNTAKTVDHMLVCVDSPESTMPSAVVTDGVAQLRNDFNVILVRRNALPIEMDLWLSSNVGQLAPLKEMNDIYPTREDTLSRPRKMVIHRIQIQLYPKTHSRRILKESSASLVRPHNMKNT